MQPDEFALRATPWIAGAVVFYVVFTVAACVDCGGPDPCIFPGLWTLLGPWVAAAVAVIALKWVIEGLSDREQPLVELAPWALAILVYVAAFFAMWNGRPSHPSEECTFSPSTVAFSALPAIGVWLASRMLLRLIQRHTRAG